MFADAIGATAQITAGTLNAGAIGIKSLAPVQDMQLNDALARPTLFSRVCAPEHHWISKWFRRHGGRYAYFIDDNLWAYREGDLGAWLSRPSVHATLNEYVRNAALVVVNSMGLKQVIDERLSARGEQATYIPPAFDFSLVPAPNPYIGPSCAFRVGFAGTAREKAFESLAEAINHIARRPGNDIEFEFIGYIPPKLKPLLSSGRIRHFPAINNYNAFIEFKASRCWSLGLAPIQDDDFTACKTNNKFREYSALGIPAIYADSALYRAYVQDGQDGLLVPDSVEAWEQAIISLRSQPDRRASMAAQALSRVRQEHDIKQVAEQWREALEGAGLCPPKSFSARTDWIMRAGVARQRERLEAYERLIADSGWHGLFLHATHRALQGLGHDTTNQNLKNSIDTQSGRRPHSHDATQADKQD